MQHHYVSMGWRDALFLHWPVDRETVQERLPPGLEARTHDGAAWLGVVAFVLEDVRPRGVPREFGLTFGEVNLRTYVAGPDGGEGIYFYNLDAADPLGVLVARTLYQLPYYRASIDVDRHGTVPNTDAVDSGTDSIQTRSVEFVSHRTHRGVADAHFDATYGPVGQGFYPDEGTLEHVLAENYRYYLAGGDVGGEEVGTGGDGVGSTGDLFYGDVEHPPWELYDAELDLRSTNLLDVNGFERPDDEPLVHYSPGVPVDADRVRKLD